MEFEWDAEKEARNLQKRGLRFSIAARVLFDPYRIEIYDGREDYGEDRWATIGFAEASLLYVVYSFPRSSLPLSTSPCRTTVLSAARLLGMNELEKELHGSRRGNNSTNFSEKSQCLRAKAIS
ncbi:MAG: BrnT family toxin [Candidatus Accumulibacter sp.]|jgi:uncharacterized DUF497 family protein|nr:BrnT family toxin [Accumulibacter sp.]